MLNEKPISTIRKAIKGTAEIEAEKEGLSKTEEKHLKESFSFYRFLKMTDPKMYKDTIMSVAQAMDLKTEMGDDLYKLFTQVLEEITLKDKIAIETEVKQLEESKTLSPKELERGILELNKKLIMMSDYGLKQDPRLISAFQGKEGLLNKTIEFVTSTMLESIKE